VFENRVLGSEREREREIEEITVGWRQLHKEERHNFYFSPNIVGATTSKRMRWVGHATRVREIRNAYVTVKV
jgi:hypothetical protein